MPTKSQLCVISTALFVLASPGCTIDPKKVATAIEDGLAERGVKPKDVVCPEGKKDKDGETFECEGHGPDGTAFKVAVAAKGGGNVEWNLVGKVSDPDELEAELKKRSGRDFDCGNDKHIAVKGAAIECKQGNDVVAIEYTDNEGHAAIREKK
jgi:hypothetical protein